MSGTGAGGRPLEEGVLGGGGGGANGRWEWGVGRGGTQAGNTLGPSGCRRWGRTRWKRMAGGTLEGWEGLPAFIRGTGSHNTSPGVGVGKGRAGGRKLSGR